jgi:hypothetical protein
MTTATAKGFTAVMAQRREPPDTLDYFPTPPWASRALFRHVLSAIGIEATGRVWEPACGEGHMAAVIAEFACGAVLASDVYAYGYGTPHDFLYDDPLTTPDWIITNPPFSIACEFTLRALELASTGVAMLVRTQWIEGIGRYEKLFRDRPPTVYAPFVERVPWSRAAGTPTPRPQRRMRGLCGAEPAARRHRGSSGYRRAVELLLLMRMIVSALPPGL